jgi:hypothetical protein
MEDTVKFEVQAIGKGMPQETCRMSYQPIQTNPFTIQGDTALVETLKPPRRFVAIRNILMEVAASSDQLLSLATTTPDGMGNPDVAHVEDVTAGCDFLVFLTDH